MTVKVEVTYNVRTDEYPRGEDWFLDSGGSYVISDLDGNTLAEYPKEIVMCVYYHDAHLTANQKEAADNADEPEDKDRPAVDQEVDDV